MEGSCSSFPAYTCSPISYSGLLFPYWLWYLLQNLIRQYPFWEGFFWWFYLEFLDWLQSILIAYGNRFRTPSLRDSIGSICCWICKNSVVFYLCLREIMIYAHIYCQLFSSILSLNPWAILLFLGNLGHPESLGQQAPEKAMMI